ncbi:hypothetical protein [Clostridium aminobutyricum]|uniref:DRTGG domain-containing protein n=1 Tax=Clostridium aminobutyricum TaxID=33953 RepID=A0A939D6P4_CLOAM|nr:hypothetical protein [Clostridium aminobutyricum]MBN7772071.1 hypothetical protein [Clostridium aminobutyricum]
MQLKDIQLLLDATLLCGEDLLETEIHSACASDLMSDVLSLVKDQKILLTGLCNTQVLRTAEMMDMLCVIMVRGKQPDASMIQMANQKNICLLSTGKTMFNSCGLLFSNGVNGDHAHE